VEVGAGAEDLDADEAVVLQSSAINTLVPAADVARGALPLSSR
jgi:hypothetical protein